MATPYSLSTPSGIQHFLQALNRADENNSDAAFASFGDAQIVLDEIWNVLDSPILPNAASGGSQFFTYRNNLRKMSLKMAVKHDILPTRLILKGVKLIDNTQHGAGGFADVYCGTYCEFKKNLVHDHVVPFIGVAEDVFENTICMVLPWQEAGSLRHYLDKLFKEGKLSDEELSAAIDKWLYQTLGLEYLHAEGIVHGDLHAGNILVNESGDACLTDFGMSLISEAAAYNFASKHGGGALRWQAPELIDPEEFGLESSRPTPQSDVFSFACTAIEENPHFRYCQATNRYIGERCWAQSSQERPSSREVVISLTTIVPGVAPLDQLVEQTSRITIDPAVVSSSGPTSAHEKSEAAPVSSQPTATTAIVQEASPSLHLVEKTDSISIQGPDPVPPSHVFTESKRSEEDAGDSYAATGDGTPESPLAKTATSAPTQNALQASSRHTSAPQSSGLTTARLQTSVSDAIVGTGDDFDFSLKHIKSMFETMKDLAPNKTLSRDEIETVGAIIFQTMHMGAWLWESLETNGCILTLDLGLGLLLKFISLFISEKLSDSSDTHADDGASLLAEALSLDPFGKEDTQLVVLSKLRCWESLRWKQQFGGDYGSEEMRDSRPRPSEEDNVAEEEIGSSRGSQDYELLSPNRDIHVTGCQKGRSSHPRNLAATTQDTK
ncbi:hypothetical protein EUX98_g2114 [Antrodiella citrinella]|uniref:Protein kinase domain-containing protein n=1 Tax=Antrodiella citrinella TaxID=2447956 RepID=A0A4S4MZV3_9APHY|nr:hypothetical protein EUX98_g2114 [Antrodiella citrinella]